VQQAIARGCQHYLLKPVQAERLLRTVRGALDRRPSPLSDRSPTLAHLGLDLASYASGAAHRAQRGRRARAERPGTAPDDRRAAEEEEVA